MEFSPPARVLLVEDDQDHVELALRGLAGVESPQRCLTVRDGPDALAYLHGVDGRAVPHELPCVIVLDLSLPSMPGLQVLCEIRRDPRTRRIPVVVFAGTKHEVDIARCYDNGANSYIVKPDGAEPFSECLRTIGDYWLNRNVFMTG